MAANKKNQGGRDYENRIRARQAETRGYTLEGHEKAMKEWYAKRAKKGK